MGGGGLGAGEWPPFSVSHDEKRWPQDWGGEPETSFKPLYIRGVRSPFEYWEKAQGPLLPQQTHPYKFTDSIRSLSRSSKTLPGPSGSRGLRPQPPPRKQCDKHLESLLTAWSHHSLDALTFLSQVRGKQTSNFAPNFPLGVSGPWGSLASASASAKQLG